MQCGVDNTILHRHVAYLHKNGISQDAGLLQCIAASGIWTQMRKYLSNLVDSPICPICGEGVEDEHHLYNQCTAIDRIEDTIIRRTTSGLYTYDGLSDSSVTLMANPQRFLQGPSAQTLDYSRYPQQA